MDFLQSVHDTSASFSRNIPSPATFLSKAKSHLPHLASFLLTLLSPNSSEYRISPSLQNILSKAYTSPLYTYPTSLTQGILHIPIHSHNDYWQPVPFYSALAVGARSIEADVWLYSDALHVGHMRSALTADRTLDALYLSPILDVLRRQNPESEFVTDRPTHNGVYDVDGTQTLYLFIDVKTDGERTWPFVLKALEPLYIGGWLSTVDSTDQFTSRAVTVIGSGNAPLGQIQAQMPRYAFFDGPIPTLNSTFSNITSQISPIASTDFTATFGSVLGTSMNDSQLALLRDQVKVAHGKGIKLRYWNQPPWPISTRNSIWRNLWSEGVDLINVDDLEAAAGVSKSRDYR